MMAKVQSAIQNESGLRRWLVQWALRVGGRTVDYRASGKRLPVVLEAQYRLADRLVLGRLRAKLGLDRASVLLSGAAALRPDVHTFFLALGLTVLEAYGLTETCPGLTVNRPGDIRIGTVGKPFQRCELKVAPDGELLARGPNITRGYLNHLEATASAFDDDGWFRTGDLGSIDADGFVRITGRKKELLKTSGGKYVAPLKIETQLKQHPIIQEAMVIGDARHYCTAVFALDAEMLAAFAQREGVPADPSHPRVHAVVEGVVEAANRQLASFEQIKAFCVVPAAFSVDGGELTASLKVKRHAVARKHAALIDAMYAPQRAARSGS